MRTDRAILLKLACQNDGRSYFTGIAWEELQIGTEYAKRGRAYKPSWPVTFMAILLRRITTGKSH